MFTCPEGSWSAKWLSNITRSKYRFALQIGCQGDVIPAALTLRDSRGWGDAA